MKDDMLLESYTFQIFYTCLLSNSIDIVDDGVFFAAFSSRTEGKQREQRWQKWSSRGACEAQWLGRTGKTYTDAWSFFPLKDPTLVDVWGLRLDFW